MVRLDMERGGVDRHFPHARGDGPHQTFEDDGVGRFSPRPWGWSGRHPSRREGRGIFPTPVGMVLNPNGIFQSVFHFPHARGDGPLYESAFHIGVAFSPRPWGWSAFWL